MKTEKENLNKEQMLTPREAAKSFIRPYLDKGDSVSLHPYFRASIKTEDYSAHIEPDNIVMVTKLYGTDIKESFSVSDIMREIVMSNAKNLFEKLEKTSPTEEYEKREQEIKALLIKLKAKLRKHKTDFLKHPSNWGYVGDLGHIAEVLKEIA